MGGAVEGGVWVEGSERLVHHVHASIVHVQPYGCGHTYVGARSALRVEGRG